MARRKVKKKKTKKKKKRETKENNGICMIIGMKRTKYIFIYIYIYISLFFRKFQPITSTPDNSSLSSYQDTNQFLV